MRKKILLCVSGTTPQIITETLYFLTHQRKPPFLPDEIHVITTTIGKIFIEDKLLNLERGYFHKLVKEYNLKKPKFNLSTIHVIPDEKGFVNDITDERINKIAGDFILGVVKELCMPEDNVVHASIAGGRKTMSFFLGMAMQFYAKDCDEMSHVLVNPPFENHPDFFYPPNPPTEITIFDSTNKYKKISTELAKISLAMIPFVRLRKYYKSFKHELKDFVSHVEFFQKSIEINYPQLIIDYSNLSFFINNKTLDLTPMERAIYFYFINKKLLCSEVVCNNGCRKCYINSSSIQIDEITIYYQKILHGMSAKIDNFIKSQKNININTWFLQHRSRINKKIANIDNTGLCLIESQGFYGTKVYGLALPKDKIIIKNN